MCGQIKYGLKLNQDKNFKKMLAEDPTPLGCDAAAESDRQPSVALCGCWDWPAGNEDEPGPSHILPFHSAHTALGASSCVGEACVIALSQHWNQILNKTDIYFTFSLAALGFYHLFSADLSLNKPNTINANQDKKACSNMSWIGNYFENE